MESQRRGISIANGANCKWTRDYQDFVTASKLP